MLNDTFPLRVESIPAAHASEWRADDSFPPSETQAWQLDCCSTNRGRSLL